MDDACGWRFPLQVLRWFGTPATKIGLPQTKFRFAQLGTQLGWVYFCSVDNFVGTTYCKISRLDELCTAARAKLVYTSSTESR